MLLFSFRSIIFSDPIKYQVFKRRNFLLPINWTFLFEIARNIFVVLFRWLLFIAFSIYLIISFYSVSLSARGSYPWAFGSPPSFYPWSRQSPKNKKDEWKHFPGRGKKLIPGYKKDAHWSLKCSSLKSPSNGGKIGDI